VTYTHKPTQASPEQMIDAKMITRHKVDTFLHALRPDGTMIKLTSLAEMCFPPSNLCQPKSAQNI
jgi:hypothetical protein